MAKKKLKIMLSSTVNHFKTEIEQIYGTLIQVRLGTLRRACAIQAMIQTLEFMILVEVQR